MYDKTMDDGKDIGVVCRVCMYRGAVARPPQGMPLQLRSFMFCVVSVNFNGSYIIFLSWCVAGVAALWETFVVLVSFTVFVVR